jgi:cytochrome c-type biogenesis protein CcmH
MSVVMVSAPYATMAADTPFEFDDPAQEQRYKNLIAEIRCLVCQNQSLEDSHAELAQDLRNEIYNMILDGQDEKEITDFLVYRYGDFVLFRPPFNVKTVLLWLGPFILLITAILIILHLKRKHGTRSPATLNAEEQQRLARLLGQKIKEDQS